MDNLKKRRRGAFKPRSDEELRRHKADVALRESRKRFRNPLSQIEAGLSGNDQTIMSASIRALCRKAKQMQIAGFRRILNMLVDHRVKWLDDVRLISGVWRIAGKLELTIREIDSWSAGTHNPRRQFGSLVRHLFARYEMPGFFDSAWLGNCRDMKKWQQWFISVGQGTALRQIASCEIEITKRVQHHTMLAPSDLDVGQAIRWGQVIALGGSERLARAMVGSQIDRPNQDEAFWTSVVQFLCANPMLDPAQVGPMIDYLYNRRFLRQPDRIVDGVRICGEIPEPNLSMKGRTVDSILRQIQAWHRQLARVPRREVNHWQPCGVPELERREGTDSNFRIWRIVELLSTQELVEEGRALHHCVASYEWSCLKQQCAIFSLRLHDRNGNQPLVTLEVIPKSRMVVQARGKYNRKITALETRVIRGWTTEAGLQIAGHAIEL